MLQFILRRLGLVIPTFIGITLLTFAFVHMIPGDPVMIMAGERGISLNVMRSCWPNWASISRCGSSTSTISGACCTVI
jgi:ABC-type dipeptide/oligopeptide/nickel transport system permease component